jgi:hypothetical protein
MEHKVEMGTGRKYIIGKLSEISVSQYFSPCEKRLKSFGVEFATYQNIIDSDILFQIFNKNNNVIFEKHLNSNNFKDNEFAIVEACIDLTFNEIYCLKISGKCDAYGNAVTAKYAIRSNKDKNSKKIINRLFLENEQIINGELSCFFIYDTGHYKPASMAIYTCITNEYDKLRDVVCLESDVEYICFTDLNIENDTWNIRKLPKVLNGIEDNIKKARCMKVMPHLFLSEYDVSMWIDGNIQIVGNLKKLIMHNLDGYNFCIPKHPHRTCIYQEMEAVVRFNKDTGNNVDVQMMRYLNENYPENYGLVQSGIIMRRHNASECMKFAIEWWHEIFKYSKRDQLSFNYVLWKNRELKIRILNPALLVSEYMSYWKHGEDNDYKIKIPENYGTMINYLNGVPV